jgi:hypothetical protein
VHKAKKLMNKFEVDLCDVVVKASVANVELCHCKKYLISLTLPILQAWLKARGEVQSGNKDDVVDKCCKSLGFPLETQEESYSSSNLQFSEFSQHELAYKIQVMVLHLL